MESEYLSRVLIRDFLDIILIVHNWACGGVHKELIFSKGVVVFEDEFIAETV